MANCPHCGADSKHWIGGAVKRPGALTREASSSGRSKLQQAEHDAHSSNPHTRGRGLLGERFLKKSI
jgi:hypothetical protein